MRLLVDKVALWHVSTPLLRVVPVSIIPCAKSENLTKKKSVLAVITVPTICSQRLGAFAKLSTATLIFVIFICLTVRPHGTTWLVLYWFSYLSISGKTIQKIQVPFESDNNNGHFTRRRMYIYGNMSLNSSLSEVCFRKIYRENKKKKPLSSITFSPPKIVPFITWKNMVDQTGHRWQYNTVHVHCVLRN